MTDPAGHMPVVSPGDPHYAADEKALLAMYGAQQRAAAARAAAQQKAAAGVAATLRSERGVILTLAACAHKAASIAVLAPPAKRAAANAAAKVETAQAAKAAAANKAAVKKPAASAAKPADAASAVGIAIGGKAVLRLMNNPSPPPIRWGRVANSPRVRRIAKLTNQWLSKYPYLNKAHDWVVSRMVNGNGVERIMVFASGDDPVPYDMLSDYEQLHVQVVQVTGLGPIHAEQVSKIWKSSRVQEQLPEDQQLGAGGGVGDYYSTIEICAECVGAANEVVDNPGITITVDSHGAIGGRNLSPDVMGEIRTNNPASSAAKGSGNALNVTIRYYQNSVMPIVEQEAAGEMEDDEP